MDGERNKGKEERKGKEKAQELIKYIKYLKKKGIEEDQKKKGIKRGGKAKERCSRKEFKGKGIK